MFETIITLNQFLLGYFERLNEDIPDDALTVRPADGNSPLWLLGHLAICGEFCHQLMGDELKHPRWVSLFGPGSRGEVSKPERFSRSEFETAIREGYPSACERLRTLDDGWFEQPHGIDMFRNSTLQTRGDFLGHLLTTHFSFHLAQLSQCRKAAGHERIV